MRSSLVLDLDLGQAGLVEQRRELADQVLVETAPFLRHERRPLLFGHYVDLPAAMRGGQRLDRQFITYRPEAADHTLHGLGDIGMMAERLAGEDIR